jgi:ABC-type multidrug transport system fused ATPase/permease subunit
LTLNITLSQYHINLIFIIKALGEDVTTARIFTALALFRLLQSLLRAFPDYVTQYFQALVSLERLEKYFNMDEKDGMCVELIKNETETRLYDRLGLASESRSSEHVMVGEISLQSCIYQWKQDSSASGGEETSDLMKDESDVAENNLLKLNIHNLKISPANLVVVKGPVGSGKSSFCHALLGEMPPFNSTTDEDNQSYFRLCGRIAYAGQQAWIQSGSLRDNIVFGLPYEKEKYDRVVDACCLIQDFSELPDGDMTFIGKIKIYLGNVSEMLLYVFVTCVGIIALQVRREST